MTSLSTRARPARDVNWIFLHPDPSQRQTRSLEISGHDLIRPAQRLFPTFAYEIKRKFKLQVNPDQMIFYTLNDPMRIIEFEDDPQLFVTLDGRSKRGCQDALSLSQILGSVEEGVVHLLVDAPLKEAHSEDVEEEEEADTVSELPAFTNYKNVLSSACFLTPSTSAKSKEYARNQKKDETVIYDGFFAPDKNGEPFISTIAPPVQIFHEVFQKFSEMIEDPEFRPDDSMVFNVSEMMLTAAAIHTAEDSKTRLLRRNLTKIFSIPSIQVQVNNRTPDGGTFVPLSDCYFPLLIMEDKCHLGQGGYDPLTQVSYSVLNQLAGDTLARIREKCCCPTFALAGGGPYLCVLGIVFTDKLIVQRLTDLMWLGEATTSEDKHLYRVAKVFTALKQSLEHLQEFYQIMDVRPGLELVPQEPHPRFFPCYTRFRDPKGQSPGPRYIDFKYVKALQSYADNVTFLVEDSTKPSCKYVVKFVDRYGVDAHLYLAGQDLAPELLYCGRLDGEHDDRERDHKDYRGPSGIYLGPLRMVVMAYIEGHNAGKLGKEQWPEEACEQVSDALTQLHDGGFVFGDLRPPNIMFRKEDQKALFIDFNWAGKSEQVRYPNRLSHAITDVANVKDFDVIRPEHDLTMFRHYFGHYA